MSVEGLCQICERNPIDEGCTRCGQLVCSDHYHDTRGWCTECVAEVGDWPDDDQREPGDRPDGVDEYQF